MRQDLCGDSGARDVLIKQGVISDDGACDVVMRQGASGDIDNGAATMPR